MNQQNPRSMGFTLIELLVVIAIVAILAAIVFPVFIQAKLNAKTVVCLSNMGQISKACMLYIVDHDDRWFSAVSIQPLDGFAPQQPWIGYDNNNWPATSYPGDVRRPAIQEPRPGAIDLYLKNHEVKKCPLKPTRSQNVLALNYSYPRIPSSEYYLINPAAEGNEWGPASKMAAPIRPSPLYDAVGAQDSEIQQTAQTLVCWEHYDRVPLCNILQFENWYDSPPNRPDLIKHFNFLHRSGFNAFWADGHSKRMAFSQLKRPYLSCRKDIYPEWPQ